MDANIQSQGDRKNPRRQFMQLLFQQRDLDISRRLQKRGDLSGDQTAQDLEHSSKEYQEDLQTFLKDCTQPDDVKWILDSAFFKHLGKPFLDQIRINNPEHLFVKEYHQQCKERVTDVVTGLKSQWEELIKSYWEIKELKESPRWPVIHTDFQTLIENCKKARNMPEVSDSLPLSLEFEFLQKQFEYEQFPKPRLDRLPENPFVRIEQILTTDRHQLLAMTFANCQESWNRLKNKHQEIHEYFQEHFADEQNEPNEDIRYEFKENFLYIGYWASVVPAFQKELERLSAALSTQLQEIALAAKSCGKDTDLCLLHQTAKIKSDLEIVQNDMKFYKSCIHLGGGAGYPRPASNADSAEELREGWLCFLPVQKRISQQVEQLFGNSHREEVGQTPLSQDDSSQAAFWSQTSAYQHAHQCHITNFLEFQPNNPHALDPFLVSSHEETKEALSALRNLLKDPRTDTTAFQGGFFSLEDLKSLEKEPHSDPERSEDEQWSGLIDVVTGWWDQVVFECTRKDPERLLSLLISLQTSEISQCLIEQGDQVQQELVKLYQDFSLEKETAKRKDIKEKIMDLCHQLFYATTALDQEIKRVNAIVNQDKQYDKEIRDLLEAETNTGTKKEAKNLLHRIEELVLWLNKTIRNHSDCSCFREQIKEADDTLKYFHRGRTLAIRDHTLLQKPASQILTDYSHLANYLYNSQKEFIKQIKPIEYQEASEKAESFAKLLPFLKESQYDPRFWSNQSSFARLEKEYIDKEHKMYAAFAKGPALDQFLEIGLQLYSIAKVQKKTGNYYTYGKDAEKAILNLKAWTDKKYILSNRGES